MIEQWSDGIYLVNRYSRYSVGCWILYYNGECAILEFPQFDGASPVDEVSAIVEQHGVNVRYLICSHSHYDHFYPSTASAFQDRFPHSHLVLQSGFRPRARMLRDVHYFDDTAVLNIGGEPLYLVFAPKHSWTDTHVIFRGSIFTGDWALGTLRSVNAFVPANVKHASIDRLQRFPHEIGGYHIHKLFSTHANDRREGINFQHLLNETHIDRKGW